MSDPFLWILNPSGAVETFFPCPIGAEPAVPEGYILTREWPEPAPPEPPPAIRVITIAAFIERFTAEEWAAVRGNPVMAREFDIKAASNGGINLDSDRVKALAGIAVKLGILTTARAAALLADGTAEEAYAE